MDLVNVEVMGFEGPVFDDPVFDLTNVSGDGRLFVGFKNLLLLSVDRNVELYGAVGSTKLLGEIEFSQGGWLYAFQVGKLNLLHRDGRPRLGGLRLCRLSFIVAGELDTAEFLFEIGVTGGTGRIAQRHELGLGSCRRSLDDKLRAPGRGHQNGFFEPGFSERIAVESNHLQLLRLAIKPNLQRHEVLDGRINHTPELLLIGLHLNDGSRKGGRIRDFKVNAQLVRSGYPGN